MATKKKATKAEAATTPAKPQYREYPPAEQFSDDLLKELYDEFQSLMKANNDPERLEFVRKLGKEAQTAIKARKAGEAESKKKHEADEAFPLSSEEIKHLATQMNEVMTLVPAIDPDADDVKDRIASELKDIHLSDFYPNADHPD